VLKCHNRKKKKTMYANTWSVEDDFGTPTPAGAGTGWGGFWSGLLNTAPGIISAFRPSQPERPPQTAFDGKGLLNILAIGAVVVVVLFLAFRFFKR
jgi:hypothetical protein